MSESIPNLWPTDFKIDVQSPFAILQVQAGLLSKVTRGILEGTVESETSKDTVQHRLVVVAPAYGSYRHTLVVVRHNKDLPYPSEVRAACLAEKKRIKVPTALGLFTSEEVMQYPEAASDEEMQNMLQQVLTSEETKAAILSLISKSNETTTSGPAIEQGEACSRDEEDQESG